MTLIISEIGINANGNVETAKQLMKMAKKCGCNLVKFQKRSIDIVYTKEELALPRESPWGITQREQKGGLEFSYIDYTEINNYSKEIDLPWFASAWDIESLDFLKQFDCPCNKIASAMITNCDFTERVAKQKKKTFISTGLINSLEPIKKAVNIFDYHNCPHVIMHCVGEYPCPPNRTNLAMINTLKAEFPGKTIGFSSHAVSPIVPAFAVLAGAEAIECHITLDRSMYGSDQAASLEKPGLEKLIDYCKIAEQVKGLPFKTITPKEIEVAKKLRWFENGNV